MLAGRCVHAGLIVHSHSSEGDGMPPNRTVEIRELDRAEIDRVLERNHVGRIGFSRRDRVTIEPVGYAYDADGWIYGRTSPGEKLAAVEHSYWVAFEVDEVEGAYDWRSVAVQGGFYPLGPDGTPADRKARERGIELLRELDPEAFTPDDPVPFRTVVFRIAAQEVTGRASTSTPAPT